MDREGETQFNWLYMGDYLQVLAPDLFMQLMVYFKSEEDEPGIYDEIRKIQDFAHQMVRYAISPNPRDSMAIDIEGEQLINPSTQRPFAIEDTDVPRERCIGSTTGVEGREQAVAQITVAIYRILQRAEELKDYEN